MILLPSLNEEAALKKFIKQVLNKRGVVFTDISVKGGFDFHTVKEFTPNSINIALPQDPPTPGSVPTLEPMIFGKSENPYGGGMQDDLLPYPINEEPPVRYIYFGSLGLNVFTTDNEPNNHSFAQAGYGWGKSLANGSNNGNTDFNLMFNRQKNGGATVDNNIVSVGAHRENCLFDSIIHYMYNTTASKLLSVDFIGYQVKMCY